MKRQSNFQRGSIEETLWRVYAAWGKTLEIFDLVEQLPKLDLEEKAVYSSREINEHLKAAQEVAKQKAKLFFAANRAVEDFRECWEAFEEMSKNLFPNLTSGEEKKIRLLSDDTWFIIKKLDEAGWEFFLEKSGVIKKLSQWHSELEEAKNRAFRVEKLSSCRLCQSGQIICNDLDF